MKRKVLFVSCGGFGNGGVQAVIMSIVRNMSDDYVFDIIIFTDETIERDNYYINEFTKYGGHVFRIPRYNGTSSFRKRSEFYYRGIKYLKSADSIMEEYGPYSVIHCHAAYESAYFLSVAAKRNIPVRISHIHIIDDSRINPIRYLLHRLLLRIIKKNATALIGCSEEACSLFYKTDEYQVVPNPYNEKIYYLNTDNLKEQINQLKIVQVGEFSDNKNQLFSLKVFLEIRNRGIDSYMDFIGFIGTEDYLKKMELFIENNNLSKYVRILPSNTNIAKVYDTASYSMVPSLHEGFGIVIVEAQASGIKCFVSDTIPRSTDCGGCVYLPLSLGYKKWAEVIINDFKKYDGKKHYDCSRYQTTKIIKLYRQLYDETNI